MQIDASQLAKQATQDIQSRGKSARVAVPLPVGLSHVVLGTWQGSWQPPPQSSGRGTDYTRQQFRVDAQGRVILGQVPQPEIQEVWVWLEPVGPGE